MSHTYAPGVAMQAWLRYVHDYLRNSFWFTPAVMTLAAILVSVLTLSIDAQLGRGDIASMPALRSLLYSGGPDGAREVLGTIASSMITVAGTVFSITIVALTLASGQFGPRLLNSFMRDRGNQVTLGTFVAAFVYSLLVLRTVRTNEPASVPDVSVSVALLFAISGLVVLIYFIHHVAVTIQAPNLVASIASELESGIDTMFPDLARLEHAQPSDASVPMEHPAECRGGTDGYVKLIDTGSLVALARDHDLLIRLLIRPGAFVVPSSTIAEIWPASCATDEVKGAVAGSVTTGGRRTAVQDIEFPIRQLAEVAVRSLSPSINDPFTAETCVDHLSTSLCELAGREFPPQVLADADGVARLVVGDPLSFASLVGTAFDQVRQCADFHASVYDRLLEALTRIVRCGHGQDRVQPLLASALEVLEAARRAVPAETDRAGIERRYQCLLLAAQMAD